MPRLSDDTLLKKAIEPACNDRKSLAECYGGTGENAQAALDLAAQFETLRGKRLDAMTPGEHETAMKCFYYAEQWEYSVEDAHRHANKEVARAAASVALAFREVRTRRWGLTHIEVALRDGVTVPVNANTVTAPIAGQAQSAPKN